jgi:hypothetical protein
MPKNNKRREIKKSVVKMSKRAKDKEVNKIVKDKNKWLTSVRKQKPKGYRIRYLHYTTEKPRRQKIRPFMPLK